MRVVAAPIQVVHFRPDESVKRRPGIIANSRDEPVLDRVPVGVIHAPFEIVFVAYRVLRLYRNRSESGVGVPASAGVLKTVGSPLTVAG